MSFDLPFRFRRLRKSATIRNMLSRVEVSANDLIYPIFVEEGLKGREESDSLPGVFRVGEEALAAEVKMLQEKGIQALMLFGVSHKKDEEGSDTWNEKGLIARMVRIAKEAAPEMIIMADACFCQYTSHGHCGVLINDHVDNDLTLENLQKQAVNAAEAGADFIAPSAMMDGQVMAIRDALDESGFEDVGVLSYSSKFASNLYGPFRGAAGCSLKQGDRKAYQADFRNFDLALEESMVDIEEGADMLMVKPGTLYLDVLKGIRENTSLPVAAYHVSGEYAMIKHAALANAIDEKQVVLETMTAFKRAGADLIITYYAPQILDWLKD